MDELILIFVTGLILFFTSEAIKKYIISRKGIKVNQKLAVNGNSYIIKGRKGEFVLCKNKRYEFKIVNGEIVSSKDRKKHCKLTY